MIKRHDVNNLLTQAILTWFDHHKKEYPWRYKNPDPYHVLVSEFMLQQTTTQTVIGYYKKFIEKFPDIQALSSASIDDVLNLWQGMGYYRRAQNLHKTAQIIVEQYNGIIPNDKKLLLALPGIGQYTAHAILAIAFNQNYLPVDGNIKRIVARYFGLDIPYEQLDKYIAGMTWDFYERADDVCQGMMDYANTICLPQNPLCDQCKLRPSCKAYQNNAFTVQKKKIDKKKLFAKGFICIKDNCIALKKHNKNELLGNLWNIPLSPFQSETPALCEEYIGEIRHIFTHIDLTVYMYKVDGVSDAEFVSFKELHNYAISRLTEKMINVLDLHALQKGF